MDNCMIISKPSLRLAGISYSGPYSAFPDETIRLQTEFRARRHELGDNIKSIAVMCPYDGNEVFATYWACHEVEHLEQLPEGMVQFTIPPHRYAMVSCTNKRIGEGYEQLKAWMAAERLEKDDHALAIEVYFIDEHLEEGPVELLIPLK